MGRHWSTGLQLRVERGTLAAYGGQEEALTNNKLLKVDFFFFFLKRRYHSFTLDSLTSSHLTTH